MQSDRWLQIEQLFHSALKMDESRRAAFLEESCAGDADLRLQLEALLAHHEEAGSFLEAPALELAAQALAPASGFSGGTDHSANALVGKTVSH